MVDMKSSENDLPETSLQDPVLLFEAISHARRIKIIQLLAKSPARFSEIKKSLSISSSGNLTHHLTKLNSLIIQDSEGKYKLTEQGHEALFSVEVVKRSRKKILQESYTWFSALIFYSIYLTIAFYTKFYHFWVPILGIGLTLIYFCIISLTIRKKVQRGEWHFLFGRSRSRRKG